MCVFLKPTSSDFHLQDIYYMLFLITCQPLHMSSGCQGSYLQWSYRFAWKRKDFSAAMMMFGGEYLLLTFADLNSSSSTSDKVGCA